MAGMAGIGRLLTIFGHVAPGRRIVMTFSLPAHR